MSLSLASAQVIAQATLQHGRTVGAAPLAVVVLDAGGHTKVVLREDETGYLRVDVAAAKAWGALGMGKSSRWLAKAAQDRPEFFGSLAQVSGGRMALAAGGVLLADDTGAIVGAVGVSGDTSDVDEQCAVAGITAAGLRALTGEE